MIISNAIQFRHIPRTGGRFLYNLFLKNNQKCVDHNFDMSFNNVEIPHLNALQTNCFYLKMFDNFTVVRNPLDRFISCLATSNTVDKKLIKKMFENKTNFFTTVNKLRQQSITNNWFLYFGISSFFSKLWIVKTIYRLNFLFRCLNLPSELSKSI